MQRIGALAGLILLTACTSRTPPQLSTGEPSLNTGQVALSDGAPDVALAICRRRSVDDPTSVAALACEADALTALGRPNEADAVLLKALTIDPKSVRILVGVGRLRLANDPGHAEKLFQLALQLQPRNAVALNDLGIAQDLQGHHTAAQASYAAAIAADPDMRAAQVNLALSMALQGRPDDGARLMLSVAGGPDATVRERHDLAAVLAMAGHVDEATRLLSPELQGADLDAALAGYRALQPR